MSIPGLVRPVRPHGRRLDRGQDRVKSLRIRTGRRAAAWALALVLGGTSTQAAEEKHATPPARWGQVVLPSGRTLIVEVADTPLKRQVGYMFREKVSETEGMVFLMGVADFHSFWMKNCKVPLDIVWMDETWRIVHIEGNLPPCTGEAPCPSYLPMQAALYILETQAGLTVREGIKLGDHIIFTAFTSPGAPVPTSP